MSAFDPSRFTVFGTGVRGFAVRMVCYECDPDEPEAVKTWTTPIALTALDTTARDHWAKWHTPRCGSPEAEPCRECDDRG